MTEWEFYEKARPALEAVFQGNDPFDAPIQPNISGRALLFPTQWALDIPSLQALARAAEAVGDDAMYLSVIIAPDAPYNSEYHWFIPLEDVMAYDVLAQRIIFENVVYSPTGIWGLMFSSEMHVVAAGSTTFIEKLFEYLVPSEGQLSRVPNEQVKEMLKFWKEWRDEANFRTDWIPGLLEHVYGREQAETFLREARWYESKA